MGTFFSPITKRFFPWDSLESLVVVVRICSVGCATLPWWWDRHQTNGMNRELHSTSFNAARCHKRLLKRTADKEVGKQLLENDEDEWTSVVRGLVADGELRSEAARCARKSRTDRSTLTVAKLKTIFC